MNPALAAAYNAAPDQRPADVRRVVSAFLGSVCPGDLLEPLTRVADRLNIKPDGTQAVAVVYALTELVAKDDEPWQAVVGDPASYLEAGGAA